MAKVLLSFRLSCIERRSKHACVLMVYLVCRTSMHGARLVGPVHNCTVQFLAGPVGPAVMHV